MAGWLLLTFLVTLVLLRATTTSGGRAVSGIAAISVGVWLIYEAAVPHAMHFRHVPDAFLLAVGLVVVVKGALRFASY